MTNKNFYLTTTLPYVNADPHIGFALEIVQADIIARYQRLMGREVFFNTGTDEHGQKIFQAAQKEGKSVEEYVDHYASRFQELKTSLNLSYDAFIRTTDPGHVAAAQELWKRCLAKGDIYKKKYKGLYCVGDEMFLRDSDLVDGKCPNHPNMTPVEIEEENYFFRLSAYQDQLLAYLEREDVIRPGWRREEAVKFVQQGLEDFSISREKARLTWGVPVPDDEDQVMYVWFDALTNYISTLGWPSDGEGKFKKFWQEGEVVQVAGKDQVRFQSIMWQAMLMSADIKTTDQVVYHGFITSGGQKMSKSLGNVIEPLALVDEYGVDAVRYFLARHVHPFDDSDFTLERFKEVYNADLANGLGNLAARIMQLAQTHLTEPVKLEWRTLPKEFTDALDVYDCNKAAEHVWSRISVLDQKITEEAPFKVVKEDIERGKTIIAELVAELAYIDQMLEPLMPETSKKIIEAIMANKKPENLFPRKD
ncbi:methionine--tRNA ligase [Candidatus Kaiserbacteria bacterium]|nr:methionine--tRNA ligase [Candidatus Kaiserbacteria bacterium]